MEDGKKEDPGSKVRDDGLNNEVRDDGLNKVSGGAHEPFFIRDFEIDEYGNFIELDVDELSKTAGRERQFQKKPRYL